jgi:hypothetical protein
MQGHLFPASLHVELAQTEHGGAVRRSRRKLERPVSTRRPMHLVLSSKRACGEWSMRKHDRAVRAALRAAARRFAVRVYDYANVGTHLHLLVRVRRREHFQGFLRSFAGIVARRVSGARRGRPIGRFFDALAWSRVVGWGRDYYGVRHYIFRNTIEGEQGTGIRRAMEQGPTSLASDRRPTAVGPPAS